jgi:hypothetical protein
MTITISAARTAALGTQTNNPFALWDNKAIGATITLGLAMQPDGPAANALTPTTYDYWKPILTSTTATYRITVTSQTFGCVGIASHNIGTLGGTVQVQRSTDSGATWLDGGAGIVTPTDDSPIVFRMVTTGANAADWRIVVAGLTAAAPLAIGVMMFGTELVFPVRFYAGFAPILSATEVDLQSNVSMGNHLLGSSVVSRGSTLDASFTYVDPAFVRGDMLPFQKHFNNGGGFFFGWRPATYASDVHYCWRNGDTLRPANDGGRDFMSFTLAMRSHDG